jgi:hypothetical protein
MLQKYFVCWRPNNVRMGYAYSKWAGSFVATRMSALGQKQTSAHVRVMSALPPKADIRYRDQHVRFGGPERYVLSASPLSLAAAVRDR